MIAKGTVMGGTIDVTNFAIDTDRDRSRRSRTSDADSMTQA